MINNSLSASGDRGYSLRRGTQPDTESSGFRRKQDVVKCSVKRQKELVGILLHIYSSVGLGKLLDLLLLTSLF